MGFKIYDFKLAAPGVVIVQVFWPDDIQPERERWLIEKLDAYYRACQNNDIFHLSFLGYLDGLAAAGAISGFREKIAAPRAAFGGYRCAYQDNHAPAPHPEQPAAETGKKEMGLELDPSPLDSLLRPDAWDKKPARNPLCTPEEEREMQDRLNNMWDDLPPGMIAE